MANGPPEEGAYQCFFNRDDLPSPMEGGTLCDFPLAQLSGFPDHEEHFPLYTGALGNRREGHLEAGGHGGEHQAAWSSVSHSGLENC